MDTAFLTVLAEEVATLQAQFPDLAERLDRAQTLLQDGRFFPEDDGRTATVASKDGRTSYLVNGSCQCKASAYRQEVCYHRLALRVYQRACDRLADDEERYTIDLAPEAVLQPAPLPEAPASVNVRLSIAGCEVQWTLRDTDEARLAGRLEALLARYPVEPSSPLVPPATAPLTPVCKFHGPMKASSKALGTFYCTKRLHDGSYCTERGGAHG